MNLDVVIIIGVCTLLMGLLINAAERITHRKDDQREEEQREHSTVLPTVLHPSMYYGPSPEFIRYEEDRKISGCLFMLIIVLVGAIALLIYLS